VFWSGAVGNRCRSGKYDVKKGSDEGDFSGGIKTPRQTLGGRCLPGLEEEKINYCKVLISTCLILTLKSSGT
jgi:hypothetical protein